MVSACSSGIEILNSFSNSIINSTVSSESAPRSLVKDASFVTSASSTPNLSTIIFLTRVAMSDIFVNFSFGCKNIIFELNTTNKLFQFYFLIWIIYRNLRFPLLVSLNQPFVMALKQIDYGSREYEMMVKLRNDLLRKPLGLSFDPKELEKEKEDVLIGAFEDDRM